MAKKHKHPEHENLERWLVSYADFITLLFATFVVLYALAQTDVSELKKIDEALQKAFSSNSVLQGDNGVMDSGSSILENPANNSFVQELMVEYISPKYETESFKQIEKSVKDLSKKGDLDGVEAKITDKGLLLTLDEQYMFRSGSADLSISAKKLLDKVGLIIYEKFIMHAIRIEGHTDSVPISSSKFPSNWELSSARSCSIVRYLISRFKFSPSIFTAAGFADTRPVRDKENKPVKNVAKNRRVEILILKTKLNDMEGVINPVLTMSKDEQIKMQMDRKELISIIKKENKISPAAEALLKKTSLSKNEVIDMKYYAKSQGISVESKNAYNGLSNEFSKDKTKQKLKIDTKFLENEEF